jgi:aryl-alcohol dehydrogenase-like predicted oxidoreductase
MRYRTLGGTGIKVSPYALGALMLATQVGVTSALLGPRTMEQLDDLLGGADVALSDDVLDRIDEIVPPGTDIGTLGQAYVPPAIEKTELRRRPLSQRSAA